MNFDPTCGAGFAPNRRRILSDGVCVACFAGPICLLENIIRPFFVAHFQEDTMLDQTR
jgi:hypothetical protein